MATYYQDPVYPNWWWVVATGVQLTARPGVANNRNVYHPDGMMPHWIIKDFTPTPDDERYLAVPGWVMGCRNQWVETMKQDGLVIPPRPPLQPPKPKRKSITTHEALAPLMVLSGKSHKEIKEIIRLHEDEA
jgi:hypothetical protein